MNGISNRDFWGTSTVDDPSDGNRFLAVRR